MTPDDITALKKTVEDWHNKHCQILADWATRQQPPYIFRKPKLEIKLMGARAAGRFRRRGNMCTYYLPYLLIEGAKYEETIAHEVCHSFTKQIMPSSKWHGDLFFFFLRIVCKFPTAERCHYSSVTKARRLGRLLRSIK
jgi:predicted SprT family Zn-dependent metalloprotease